MLNYFTKIFANKAIAFYFMLLLAVAALFPKYIMPLWIMPFGIVSVLGFFLGANYCTKGWANLSPKTFKQRLFGVSFILRVVYVLFSYWFYQYMTGTPFEFGAADVWLYNALGIEGHTYISNGIFNLLEIFTSPAYGMAYSDVGFPIYLSVLYLFFDDSIIVTRLFHALWMSWVSVLIYKLAARNFGENTGRMAGIFCMLMPNFIYHCGLHLKEPVMVFLTVLFVERADFLLRGSKIDWKQLLLVILVGAATFFFRTVLGAVLFAALGCALVMSSSRVVSWGKKLVLSIFVLGVLAYGIGGQIADEVSTMWENKDANQSTSMQWRAQRKGGNELAKYAGAAVFAPLIFTLPFPTVVNTAGQENQQILNGGNYVKNIMSFFTIFSLFSLLFSGEWRKHVLPLAFMCGYLVVIALSAFAHSERFHLPALPFVMMFSAYGVSLMQNKHKRWFNYWCILIFIIGIAWSWFKLKGRGMV